MAAFRSGNDELVMFAVENRLFTGGSFVSMAGEMVDGYFCGEVSTGSVGVGLEVLAEVLILVEFRGRISVLVSF